MFTKRTALALALLLIVAAGCGDDDSSGGESAPEATSGSAAPALDGTEIAFINAGVNEFSTCFVGGLERGLAGTGAEVLDLDSQFTPGQQQANVEDVIARGVDAAVLVGLASELSANSLDAFADAGIPVILMYEPAPPGTDPAAIYYTDLEKLGHNTVDALIERIPDARQIGLITGVAGITASDIPEAAVTERISEHDGVELVGAIPGLFNRDAAAAATEDMIQANPDVDVLIVFSDEMGQAAQRVLEGAGREDIELAIVSLYSTAGYQAVADGDFALAMGLPAASIGLDVAELVSEVIQGETPGPVEFELPVLDADNIADADVGCF
ncbi:MAG: sugar ABC transporter substrate-binding protein [Acidimicrobiales bacterium]